MSSYKKTLKVKNLEHLSTILPKQEKQLEYHRFLTGKQGGCPQETHFRAVHTDDKTISGEKKSNTF